MTLASLARCVRRVGRGLREFARYRDRPATHLVADAIHDCLLDLGIARRWEGE